MVDVLARNIEYTPVTHMSNLERDESGWIRKGRVTLPDKRHGWRRENRVGTYKLSRPYLIG